MNIFRILPLVLLLSLTGCTRTETIQRGPRLISGDAANSGLPASFTLSEKRNTALGGSLSNTQASDSASKPRPMTPQLQAVYGSTRVSEKKVSVSGDGVVVLED